MEPFSSLPDIDLAGRRILVVDDDRINLRILSGILRGDRYVLIEVESGEAALEIYAKSPPDLVLLDVMLPGIDGFETCRRLKKIYGVDTAPVIFITAKSESDDVVQGLAAGGVDYLPKPFKPKEVLARIRSHMHSQILVERQKLLVDQLSKANAAKNRFLGMAAHDLRNPLASIRGLAEFLTDGTVGQLTPDQLDLVKTIHSASQSMLDLVNELLDVATIEAGELKLQLEPDNLAALLGKSVFLNNIEAAKKNTRIVMSAFVESSIALIDSAKIRQVADNLISNAVKYSPPGSTITVELHTGPGVRGFSVKDQGPGVPDAEHDKLFKDFSKLSAKPTAGEKSTGLGLAICRKIIAAHRGTISAQNLPQLGCEFRVTLPCSP
ncbi:MAG: hybrid sensor histidine kinase/response regulator [Undibacterium sp.]|nr:hybrid sensor histidine kinase/response regulator [Opitutaceae bacterium]